MRPLLVLLIAIFLLGSVGLYLSLAARIAPPSPPPPPEIATGNFSLDLTLTFDARADDFSPHAVRIEHQGEPLFVRRDRIPAGVPIVVPITGLTAGEHEWAIEAVAGDSEESATDSPNGDPFAEPIRKIESREVDESVPSPALPSPALNPEDSSPSPALPSAPAPPSPPLPRSLAEGANVDEAMRPLHVARAVRIRILRDGAILSESTLWSEPGEPVQGIVRVVVPEQAPADSH